MESCFVFPPQHWWDMEGEGLVARGTLRALLDYWRFSRLTARKKLRNHTAPFSGSILFHQRTQKGLR